MTRAQGKHREFSLNQSVATLTKFSPGLGNVREFEQMLTLAIFGHIFAILGALGAL